MPAEQRGFNFERFDGRISELGTNRSVTHDAAFFPGKKLLWVDNAPYFFSREQKGELGEKIIELWRDGKREDASKLLIDLLVVEGWTQEQWDRLDSAASKALLALLGSDGADSREDAEALLAYCKDPRNRSEPAQRFRREQAWCAC